jgi:site-specific DNA-methyltransferase (adenine-specific)
MAITYSKAEIPAHLQELFVPAEIGLEPTPDEFVAALVEVFREVRRVLRDDGTVWLNLGDSYAQSGGAGAQGTTGQRASRTFTANGTLRAKNQDGIKPKDLIGIPWRVAFALQADGWYLRQDIIWAKPNPMPESVRDRCTKSHEYIFLLSKSPRYYFDHGAIKEPVAASTVKRLSSGAPPRMGGDKYGDDGRDEARTKSGEAYTGLDGMRNKRDVWTVATRPYREAHFATFPPALIEPCVLAGCPEGGTTGLVAEQHGRHSVLCELNPEYAAMAAARIGPMAVVL